MTRLKGEVKSIAVTEIAEGMQVLGCEEGDLKSRRIGKIVNGRAYHFLDTYSTNITELKTLVVEYEDLEEYRQDNPPFSGPYPPTSDYRKQLPLKYSQWQSAIDNSEVDSDKEVEFMRTITCLHKSCEGECGECNHMSDIAKIVPQKKRTYSEEDMKAAFESEGHTLGFKDWLSNYNKRN